MQFSTNLLATEHDINNRGSPDFFRFGDRFSSKEPTGKLAGARRTFQFFNWLVACLSYRNLKVLSKIHGFADRDSPVSIAGLDRPMGLRMVQFTGDHYIQTVFG